MGKGRPYLSVFVLALDKDVLEEVVVVLLHLLVAHRLSQMASISSFGRILWVDVEVLDDQGLRECWLVMNSATPVPMPASPDLEVEAAVHLILLCPKD